MAFCTDLTDATAHAVARIGIGLDSRSSLPDSAAEAIWTGQQAHVVAKIGQAGLAIGSTASAAKSWAADVERKCTSGHCLMSANAGTSEDLHAYGKRLVDEAEAELKAAAEDPLYGWLLGNGATTATLAESGWVWSSWAQDRDPNLDTTAGRGRPYQQPPVFHEGDPS